MVYGLVLRSNRLMFRGYRECSSLNFYIHIDIYTYMHVPLVSSGKSRLPLG